MTNKGSARPQHQVQGPWSDSDARKRELDQISFVLAHEFLFKLTVMDKKKSFKRVPWPVNEEFKLPNAIIPV